MSQVPFPTTSPALATSEHPEILGNILFNVSLARYKDKETLKTDLHLCQGFLKSIEPQFSLQEPGPLTSTLLNVPDQNLNLSIYLSLSLLPSPSAPLPLLPPLSSFLFLLT